MAPKSIKPTKKSPEKSAPISHEPRQNKQRVTKLTAKEKRAAHLGGWIDERIPTDLIEKRLRNEPRHEFRTDALLPALATEMGNVRLMANAKKSKLEPAQVARQARDTAAAIDELIERLLHMEPRLRAAIDKILYQSTGDAVIWIRDATTPGLLNIRVASLMVAMQIENQQSKTGPKPSARREASNRLAQQLRKYSIPPLPLRASRDLAEELIALCESHTKG